MSNYCDLYYAILIRMRSAGNNGDDVAYNALKNQLNYHKRNCASCRQHSVDLERQEKQGETS